MGLDAHVSCNCYELGKLREPPPVPLEFVQVDPRGYLIYSLEGDPEWKAVRHLHWADPMQSEVFEKQIEFGNWYLERACEHDSMLLLHHRIGNVFHVGDLRNELRREVVHFPIILGKVIYSGSHAGDWLTLEDIEQLKPELEVLKDFQCEDQQMISFMPRFRQQMVELVEASLSIGKPIWF